MNPDVERDKAALIPTWNRGRLSRELSYPVTVGDISAALVGCPHRDDLKLSFHDLKMAFIRSEHRDRYREKLQATEPVRVLKVEVQCRYKIVSAGPDYAGRYWYLTVRPVLRQQRSAARRLIVDRGLPLIQEWLTAARPETWYEGTRWRWIELDLAAESVRAIDDRR